MNSQIGAQGRLPDSSPSVKAQLATYLSSQPESTRGFHARIKILELAALALILVALIFALFVSTNSRSFTPITIPVVWFVFAASFAPTLILFGLHTIKLGAFPPVVLPGKNLNFATGRGAVWQGLTFILAGLLAAAFWGLLIYIAVSGDLSLLIPFVNLVGLLLGFVIVASILLAFYKAITRIR